MTEKEVRLPTQRELEEHCSLIQAYIQNYDAESDSKTNDSESDTQSISSYTCGPNDAREPSDDSFSSRNDAIKSGGPKAGQAYTSADNTLIWQAYSGAKTPQSRQNALGKVALQLGRSYNGIVRHVRHLREQRLIASATAKIDASDSTRDSESESDDSSSSSISYISYVGDATSRAVQPMKAVPGDRVAHGKGFIYTEEDDTDIWAAYLSTTNIYKRTEALRAVAVRQGRKYAAVMSHLKKLLAAQHFVREKTVPGDRSSTSRDGPNVVQQVSDVSDSEPDCITPAPTPPSSNVALVPTPASTDANTLSMLSLKHPERETYPDEWGHYTHIHSPYHDNAHQSSSATVLPPYNPPIEMSLQHYRNTVSAAVYAPETVNGTLGGFVKTLRAEEMDLVFPAEVHDQVLCIILGCFLRAQRNTLSISHQTFFATIAAARTALQSTFFHLHGVSNCKLHRVMQLLRVAHCTTVRGGRWAEQQIHLDREIQSMAVLRRRHDRCLARRMRSEHRAYLEDLLLWPLDAEAERVKIHETDSVKIKVQRVLDNLARQPKYAILRA